MKVLVIDDEPMVGKITAAFLCMAGHEVEQASSAAEALQKISPNFDAVVVDASMEGVGERSLARQLTEQFPEVKTLVISGFDSSRIKETVGLSADFFLQKPFSQDALKQALDKMMSDDKHA